MDKKIEDLKGHIKILSERKNLYNKIMDYLQEGILVVDENRDVLFCNHAFAKHLDFSGASSLFTLEELKKHPIFKNILEETKDSDFVNYSREVEIFSPSRKILNIRAIRLDSKGPSISVIYIIQNTTAMKQESKETFNERKLGAVLTLGAGIAHELGNPLNALNIHLQIVKRSLKGKSKKDLKIPSLKEELDIVQSEVKRMDYVIKSFLKAIRPERINYKEIEIVKTIRFALASTIKIAETKGIFLEFKPELERKFIFADAQKIEQALINVVRNAMEAIKNDGKIIVTCKEEKGYIVIKVTDDGPGITEERISRIFDPFYTTKETGVGLGLVISYRIIREHDGDISVKSSPGKGTTFQITLPLKEYRMKFLESKIDKRE